MININVINEYVKRSVQKRVESEFEMLKDKMVSKFKATLEDKKNEICVDVVLEMMMVQDITDNLKTINFIIKEIK